MVAADRGPVASTVSLFQLALGTEKAGATSMGQSTAHEVSIEHMYVVCQWGLCGQEVGVRIIERSSTLAGMLEEAHCSPTETAFLDAVFPATSKIVACPRMGILSPKDFAHGRSSHGEYPMLRGNQHERPTRRSPNLRRRAR